MIQVNRKTVELSRFPDGTLHLVPEIDMSNADYHVTISWYYENDSEMAALMFLTRKIDWYNLKKKKGDFSPNN